MDCNTNAKCNDTGVCECNAGYEGDGKSKCDGKLAEKVITMESVASQEGHNVNICTRNY